MSYYHSARSEKRNRDLTSSIFISLEDSCKEKLIKCVKMLQFVVFFLFSVIYAKNYAIIYASIEPIRDTDLPSTPCRIITVSIKSIRNVIVLDCNRL